MLIVKTDWGKYRYLSKTLIKKTKISYLYDPVIYIYIFARRESLGIFFSVIHF